MDVSVLSQRDWRVLLGAVTLTQEIVSFMESQPIYFVATAPLSPTGHINCSPKGGTGTFKVIDSERVAYLDYVGSGIETVAHLRENNRIVVMFASFSEKPKIVRVHGRGIVHEPHTVRYHELLDNFKVDQFGTRTVIEVEIERVSTSCGYGVPHMQLLTERPTMSNWLHKKGKDALASYKLKKNAQSIDGLAALTETD